jgi:hypothetical protein
MNGQRTGRWEKSAIVSAVAEGPELRRLLMRQLQQIVQQPQLVHHFERRGMDRVAAEVAQKVGVLLQHQHVHAGARQQQASIIPAGPPPAMQHCCEMLAAAMAEGGRDARRARAPSMRISSPLMWSRGVRDEERDEVRDDFGAAHAVQRSGAHQELHVGAVGELRASHRGCRSTRDTPSCSARLASRTRPRSQRVSACTAPFDAP